MRNDQQLLMGLDLSLMKLGNIGLFISKYQLHHIQIMMQTWWLSEKKGSKNYKGLAADDAPPTLFEYYQNLASKIGALDKSHTLYIYASTKTFYSNDWSVFKQMLKQSQHRCVVGLLDNKSDFFQSCSLLYIYAMA